MIEKKQPTLSLILCSRNDSYMGDPMWRLETSLKFTAEAIHKLNLENQVQIIINDWGSKEPIREVLSIDERTNSLISFLEVPQDVVNSVQKDSPFAEVLAHNVTIRRVSSDFIGKIDQDTLVDENFFKSFFSILDKKVDVNFDPYKSFMFVGRRSIPIEFSSKKPGFSQVKNMIDKCRNFLPREGQGRKYWFEASTGVMLMSRDLWNECGAYDENLIYWGYMETDLAFRVKKKYPLVNLKKWMDFPFYHLDHAPREFLITPRRKNHVREDNSFNPNSNDWGMENQNFEFIKSSKLNLKSRSDNGKYSLLSLYWWSIKEWSWEVLRFIMRQTLTLFGVHSGYLAESKVKPKNGV